MTTTSCPPAPADNPWAELERGAPLQALRCWRAQLLQGAERIRRHLAAAEAGLPGDALGPLRRQALELLAALAAGEPSSREQEQLGALLRGWGALCLSHAPGRALQHFERAWSCGADPHLEQQLANLYARQGMATGALALAQPAQPLPPWPSLACAGLHCQPCQHSLAAEPLPAEPPLQLIELAGGQVWIERNSQLGETQGVAAANRAGELLPQLCRRYPWQWPGCTHSSQRLQESLQPLILAAAGQPLQLQAPVLAVADLSAELHYHGLLELLPRLGRAWQALAPQLPGLHLWHNGGNSPWLQQALAQLGIPAERQLNAHQHPHLQASQLLLPSFTSSFGAPGLTSLAWLRQFWRTPEAATSGQPRWLLSRPLPQRRPLLQHQAWQQQLRGQGFTEAATAWPLARQLQALQQAEQVVAVHGGAMANLLLLPPGAEVIELANPAYAPPYFASLMASGQLRHRRLTGEPTPEVLQHLLYAGPLEWPVDLPPQRP